MPIITFQGLSKTAVESYYDKIDEISQLIQANHENIFFVINETSQLINQVPTAYIQVEWIGRPNKEALLVKHLKKHFSSEVDKIAVFFTDVNGKLFIDEKRIG